MLGLDADLLIAVAIGFAISIGAHYTGACMGMPYAMGTIRPGRALALMAPLAIAGAALLSEGVESTVGHGLLRGGTIALGVAIAAVGASLVLTSGYNLVRVPTSTIQILVFATVGSGLGAGLAVDWPTIDRLLLVWAIAPVAAFVVGYGLLRVADRFRRPSDGTVRLGRTAVLGVVGVGAAASFAMGANDVANASGALIMTGVFGLLAAGIVGGVGLAVGILTWGRPLLERVAFDLVKLDGRMAVASQMAQSAVVLASVLFGLFTSLNQALVGAMLGAGLARGQSTIVWKPIRNILTGWAVGPASGLALGYLLSLVALRMGLG